jgi:hypothetical protein
VAVSGSSPFEAPPCVVCGHALLEAVTPHDVVAFGGQRLRFERHTDFVLCPGCMTLYRIEDLRSGRAIPVTDRELIRSNEASPEDTVPDEDE